MIGFFKKIYSILLQQNGWWLEQFQARPSIPMLAGLSLFIGYIVILSLFKLNSSTAVSGSILGVSLILVSISGILWIREDRFPYYITGLFKGSHQHQKFQAIFWVIFWGGLGLIIILSALMGW